VYFSRSLFRRWKSNFPISKFKILRPAIGLNQNLVGGASNDLDGGIACGCYFKGFLLREFRV
jgi:hypothetical protein